MGKCKLINSFCKHAQEVEHRGTTCLKHASQKGMGRVQEFLFTKCNILKRRATVGLGLCATPAKSLFLKVESQCTICMHFLLNVQSEVKATCDTSQALLAYFEAAGAERYCFIKV